MAKRKRKKKRTVLKQDDPKVQPDWTTPCEICGQVPTVPLTGMCGPCTFGEASTANGGWLE